MIFLPLHREYRFRLCASEKVIEADSAHLDPVYTEKNSMAL
ncbi:Uncharacterised protein [Buttiauxella agrestis]|uniref:Uncharacterized protein n=2 Tax=Buttiauxella agrestis TaxID=82977 RepID=A0A085GLS9_9ENTR|nr:hypothetical protein GBAG_0204 [Buttiauxella agrestis ATCC 33320]SUW65751.1 Uncharacterised protein [Buttiauxella agrestis]